MTNHGLGRFVAAVGVAMLVLQSLPADAGPGSRLVKAGSRSLAGRLLARDARRDAVTRITRLPAGRKVFRYVSQRPRVRDGHTVFPSGTHFTSRANRGRPMTAATAQRTYGLPARPRHRLTLEMPKHSRVRFNRVMGGAPGRGELTVAKRSKIRVLDTKALK